MIVIFLVRGLYSYVSLTTAARKTRFTKVIYNKVTHNTQESKFLYCAYTAVE